MNMFYNLTDIIKCIFLFHLQRLSSQHKIACFSYFLKIKCKKIFLKLFPQILCFYTIFCGFVFVFLETDENNFLGYFAVYTIKFPTIWCVFQPCRSKTVGEDTFPADKS